LTKPLTIEVQFIRSGARELLACPVCFTANPGEITVLQGQNGAGKSVLLTCLSGWHDRIENLSLCGTLVLDGQVFECPRNLIDFSNHARGTCAMMSHRLFEESLGATVAEECQMLLHQCRSNHLRDLERVLSDVILASHSTARPEQLGDGIRQLLAAVDVLSLASSKKTVLLDEPTSYMSDSMFAHFARVLDCVRQAAPQTIFMLATHDERLLRIATTTIELGGRAMAGSAAADTTLLRPIAVALGPLPKVEISLKGSPVRGRHPLPFNYDERILGDESCILLGPNGSGKSTFLAVCARFCAVRGKISHRVDGRLVGRFSPLFPRVLGYMFQEPYAYEFRDRVRDVLTWPQSREIAESCSYATFCVHLCVALGVTASQRLSEVSAGQLRVLWLFSQFVWAGRWLLDEPEASLDARWRRFLKDLLELHTDNGGTFLNVTHEPAFYSTLNPRTIELPRGDGS
jgi:energy-coupling factor transporter ATP-binding protein EcfA2